MCVCLRVCLCVLAYVAVDLCGSLCVVTVDSCFVLYSFWEASEEATLILTHYWYRIVLQFPWMTLALDACTGHGNAVWWSGSGGQNRK